MGRKFMQHVFTLIALLGIAAALFLGYKLVKGLDYRKGQEALEDVYRVMDSAVYETEEYSGLDAAGRKGTAESSETGTVRGSEPPESGYAGMDSYRRHEGGLSGHVYPPDEPEFYINRNFDKEKSSYGMIFIDGDCQVDQSTPNILIYGHHMKNGDMFAEIEKYNSREFQEAHPYVKFDTLAETGTYQVIATSSDRLPAG